MKITGDNIEFDENIESNLMDQNNIVSLDIPYDQCIDSKKDVDKPDIKSLASAICRMMKIFDSDRKGEVSYGLTEMAFNIKSNMYSKSHAWEVFCERYDIDIELFNKMKLCNKLIKYGISSKIGNKAKYPECEKEMIERLLLKHSFTKKDILSVSKDVFEQKKIKHPKSKDWWLKFVSRHCHITSKIDQKNVEYSLNDIYYDFDYVNFVANK